MGVSYERGSPVLIHPTIASAITFQRDRRFEHIKRAENIPLLHPTAHHARRFGGLFQKASFQEFQTPSRSMTNKRLQERANGSKNGLGMPPRRAFCVYSATDVCRPVHERQLHAMGYEGFVPPKIEGVIWTCLHHINP